jgi:3-hydroxy-9,10-secoandrosta-1,3,5(10)-triene-9,17-dione monooxygenase reductase component
MAEDQEALCRDFAISGTDQPDKFSGVGWSPGQSGVPILEGALAWVTCRIGQTHEAGDHEIVVGEVIDMGVDRSGRPVIFYRGGFGRFEP